MLRGLSMRTAVGAVAASWSVKPLGTCVATPWRFCADASGEPPRKRRVALRVRVEQAEPTPAVFDCSPDPPPPLEPAPAVSFAVPPPSLAELQPPREVLPINKPIHQLSEASDAELAQLWADLPEPEQEDGPAATAALDSATDPVEDFWNQEMRARGSVGRHYDRMPPRRRDGAHRGPSDEKERPAPYRLPTTLLRIASGKETAESAFAPRTVPVVDPGVARAPRMGRVPAPLSKGRWGDQRGGSSQPRRPYRGDPADELTREDVVAALNRQSNAPVWNARREGATNDSARRHSDDRRGQSSHTGRSVDKALNDYQHHADHATSPNRITTPRLAQGAHRRRASSRDAPAPPTSTSPVRERQRAIVLNDGESDALEDSEADFLRNVAEARSHRTSPPPPVA